MSGVALACWLVYGGLAVGVRLALHRRQTGSWGVSGVSGRPFSVEWVGGVLFVIATVLGPLAPVLAIADVSEPIGRLDTTAAHVAGLALFALGLTGLLIAQEMMGRSWRIGVDEQERTDLVTIGLFSLVRNPIYTAMLPTVLGLTLMVPNVVALVAFAGLVTALEIQTRFVEEPYLLGAHGDRYARYAGRVGRFIPGIGRLEATGR
jgi:protein-S-isoprenylcysteine O-methyltransferase Ste14